GHVPQKLKAEGKVRAIVLPDGFLRDPDHQMLRAAVADPCVDAIMVGFNLSNRSAANSLIPAAKQKGLAVIGMFAVRGLLHLPAAADAVLREEMKQAGIRDLPELAYRYCRHQPGIDIVLTGTSNPAHLRQNIESTLGPPLPPALFDSLRAKQAQADDGSIWKRSS